MIPGILRVLLISTIGTIGFILFGLLTAYSSYDYFKRKNFGLSASMAMFALINFALACFWGYRIVTIYIPALL